MKQVVKGSIFAVVYIKGNCQQKPAWNLVLHSLYPVLSFYYSSLEVMEKLHMKKIHDYVLYN